MTDDPRPVLDALLDSDSDLLGPAELQRLALARALLDLSTADQAHPAISAFITQVSAQVRQRTAALDDACPASPRAHAWQAVEGGHERTWPAVELTRDEGLDGVTACIAGPPTASSAGDGPTLLRCSRPGCRAERYVPFEWDVQWSW